MPAPPKPKIYHITHVNNLPDIISDGCLVSDAEMVSRGGPTAAIGMSSIKTRRLALRVPCHAGDHVGDYVPFYFCPRSIMLFVIHCANHPELQYRGGQGPIVHLEADLHDVIAWANSQGRRWAFTLSNAGAVYAEFRSDVDALDEIDWASVEAGDFRSPVVKEGKQAEFLVRDQFPWELVERIGARSVGVAAQVQTALKGASSKPSVATIPAWYY